MREWPLGQKHRGDGFQPRAAGLRKGTIRRADSLAESKSALGLRHAFDPAFVAVCQRDLGEAGVNVDESAAARPFVFLPPVPEWHGAHDEQVSPRTNFEK